MDSPLSYGILLLAEVIGFIVIWKKAMAEIEQRKLESELAWEELEQHNKRIRFLETHTEIWYDEGKEELPF